MRLKTSALVAVVALAMASTAQAAFITGSLSLSSTVTTGQPIVAVDAAGSATTLGAATGIDFTAAGTQDPGVDGVFGVDTASGDLSALVGETGTIVDLMFTGAAAGGYQAPPIVGFELINGIFAADLLSVNVDFQNDTFLALSGTALLRLNGFDDTFGTFALTAQQVGGAFSFSASQGVNPIPEPAALSLFGLGMLGVAVGIRRKNRSR